MKNLKKLMLSFAIASAAMAASAPSWAETTIRVGSWLPPAHTMNADVLPTWGKWIEEATEGRVKLKIEYPGGDPKALLDQVQDGAYEAAWTFHGYYPGRFKLTKMVELPGIEGGAKGASIAHWRINEKYLAKANEHEGVVLAGLFTHGPGQIHLAKPIEKLSDMKGKKIRIGGGVQADIGKAMGVEGVAAPGSKVYEILAQGVADGAFMPMGEKKTLRLKEVAPFSIKFPNGMYLGSFMIILNQEFMEKLDAKDRDAIMKVSGEKLSALAGEKWGSEAEAGEKDALAAGNTIKEATPEMLTEFAEMTKDFDKNFLESVKDSGVDAEAALKELREIAKAEGSK